MKTIKIIIGALLISFLLGITSIHAQNKLDKTIKDSFKISENTVLNIDVKFSSVEIIESESDEIRVSAKITAESYKEAKAQEILDKIDIELSQTEAVVSVKTIYNKKINTGKDSKFDIKITIEAPDFIDIDLQSKYGSVYLENCTGRVNLDVAYGSLNIGSLSRAKEKPLNEINLAYSRANIEEAAWLKMALSYSKMNIEEVRALVLISKYSVLTAEECSSLVTDSKYDTYRIEELKNFNGNLKYSNLKIENLEKKLEIISAYTPVNIEEMGANFEVIKIDNTRGSYKIGINQKSSFSVEATSIRGGISIPDIEILQKKVENSRKYIEGKYGDHPKGSINVISTEGSVKFYME